VRKTVRNQFAGLLAAFAVLGAGGCASSGNSAAVLFREAASGLPPETVDLLLETVRVVMLAERYAEAFRSRDEREYISCFSPQFSYYENSIAWLRKLVREDFFDRYTQIGFEIETMELTIFKPAPAFWMRQDEFDWLQGAQAARPLACFYSVDLGGPDPVLVRLGRPGPRPPGKGKKEPSAPECLVPVMVLPVFDPGLEFPMAELRLRTLTRLVAGAGAVESRREQVWLLEKQGGNWRIVSLR
jgi:hypothetical protein